MGEGPPKDELPPRGAVAPSSVTLLVFLLRPGPRPRGSLVLLSARLSLSASTGVAFCLLALGLGFVSRSIQRTRSCPRLCGWPAVYAADCKRSCCGRWTPLQDLTRLPVSDEAAAVFRGSTMWSSEGPSADREPQWQWGEVLQERHF